MRRRGSKSCNDLPTNLREILVLVMMHLYCTFLLKCKSALNARNIKLKNKQQEKFNKKDGVKNNLISQRSLQLNIQVVSHCASAFVVLHLEYKEVTVQLSLDSTRVVLLTSLARPPSYYDL